MSNRWTDADQIWNGGACNPRAVARALVRAIDEATDECGGDAIDPAVQMIIDHLCFLVGLPQPSLDMMDGDWLKVEKEVADHVATV